MRLNAPLKAPDFVVKDIHGVPVRLADYRGRRLMISFFRDARCPFCNLRIYQLTHHYTDWRARNLEILTFFSSDAEAIRSHLARHPRPFTMIGDPELAVYEQYRVEHSRFAAMKAMFLRMHRMLLGLRHGGAMTLGKHKTIVPADFLVRGFNSLVQRVG